ncbi:LysM peptidoglycan-binding domain-containing protein [Devriesea agamarum]|uniref:LysM peptidoglycan-binding domain-containing protein n=1 Tax=Devriesea agamarum TaxID=472569 RepID=UPI00071E1919|nr:LysM peptidoglycan-binding domain-containing protein [Devriesea agamarum]
MTTSARTTVPAVTAHPRFSVVKAAKALVALGILGVLVGGIPSALVLCYGNPFPSRLPTLDEFSTLATSTNTLNIALGAVVWIGWIAWGTFVVSVGLDLVARAKGVRIPHIRALTVQQGAATLLITAVISGFGAPVLLRGASIALSDSSPVPDRVASAPLASGTSEAQTMATAATAPGGHLVGPYPGASLTESYQSVSAAYQPSVANKPPNADAEPPSTDIQPPSTDVQPPTVDVQPPAHDQQSTSPAYAAATRDAQAEKLQRQRSEIVSHLGGDHDSPTQSVTVRSGDTLWSLANTHLGNGSRWREISELNSGVTQPDGDALEPGPNAWLTPGWTLRLPAAQPVVVTVGPHDTLSGYAKKYYGDAHRWHQIFTANAGVRQFDGRALSDPNLIVDGWTLTIPNTTPDAATKSVHRPDAPGQQPYASPRTPHRLEPRPHPPHAGRDSAQTQSDPHGPAAVAQQTAKPPHPLSAPAPVDPDAPVDTRGRADTTEQSTSADAARPAAPASPVSPAERPSEDAQGSGSAGTAPFSGTAASIDTSGPANSTTRPTDNAAGITNKAGPANTTGPTNNAAGPTYNAAEPHDESSLWSSLGTSAPWGGLGVIAATSIIGLLAARRLRAQRQRSAREAIPGLIQRLAEDERHLIRRTNPELTTRISRAVRKVVAVNADMRGYLPDLVFMRCTEEYLEFRFASAAVLPAPFEPTSEGSCWRLPAAFPLGDDLDSPAPFPYPLLLPLGEDHGEPFLVNLEHLANLGVTARDGDARSVLRAMILFCATSPWASDLLITVIGLGEDIDRAFDPGQVHCTPDVPSRCRELEHKLVRRRSALAQHGYSSASRARLDGVTNELWPPELVVIGPDLSATDRQRLINLIRAFPDLVSTVIVTDNNNRLDHHSEALSDDHLPSPWTLNIYSDQAAILDPIAVSVVPHCVCEEDASHLLDALAASSVTERAADATALRPLPVVDDRPTLISPQAPASARPPHPHAKADTGTSTNTNTNTNSYTPGISGSPIQVLALPKRSEQLLRAEDLHDRPSHPPTAPFLRCYGTPAVQNARGAVDPAAMAETVEVAIYLHLFPDAPCTELCADLWPGQTVTRSARMRALSQVRRWFGMNDDGHAYLDLPDSDTAPVHFSEDVTSDWARLHRIANIRGEVPAEHLADALRLVRGQPCAWDGAGRYAWAAPARAVMIQDAADIAHELAQRALDVGDTTTALWAVEHGLRTDPLIEMLWQLRLLATRDNPELHRHHAEELLASATQHNFELSAATKRLTHQVGRRRRMTPPPHHSKDTL